MDIRHIGHRFAPFGSVVEAGRIRLFCKATGNTDAIYLDAEAAQSAGYRNVVAPLTFPSAIAMDNPNPRSVTDLLEVELKWILHAEEHYNYRAPICAGDVITTSVSISDIFDKKGGALEFAVSSLIMQNQMGEAVCTIRRSIVVQRRRD